MLLTISTTHQPAFDLGYLLHKHPDKLQEVQLPVGKAHIFYPESTPERATVALLLDIDPIEMVRGGRNLAGREFSLGQYVNDRPYVASSFLSVAISKAFSTAMNGRCKDRPELVDQALPLEVKIAVLPAAGGGETLIRKLFEPLGYEVNCQRHTLDTQFPEWGDSKYFTVSLLHHLPLKELLTHLYVLIPVLDNGKHYYVSENEIKKLLDKGKGWLEDHPEKALIAHRFLYNLKSLANEALARLEEAPKSPDSEAEAAPAEEIRKKETLHQQRLALAVEKLKATGAKSVIDLGCGEGKLLKLLLREKQFERIAGMDVSWHELNFAKEKLHWEELAPRQKQRITLFQGALTYRDKRLEGYDAAALVEVIEHLDENRLPALERVVFEFAQPQWVVLTTPNAEFNSEYENLSAGTMRHSDHRFEWTRAQFESWANQIAQKFNYSVNFYPVGEAAPEVGAPSQMAVFKYGNPRT